MPRRVRFALAGAAASTGLLFVCWLLAFHVGFAARADVSVLNGFIGLGHGRNAHLAYRIARLCSPNPYVYLAAVPVLVALVRRRPLVALVIIAILIGANATTELLKPLLAATRPASDANTPISIGSWPSGHATAAMSLALCCLIAAPARLRPWVAALGAVFAVAVSYSFLSLAWHYPSDVCGGFLIATAWTLLGVAALFAVRDRRASAPEPRRARIPLADALEPPVAAVFAALALVAIVVLARPHAVVQYARYHKGFVIGAIVIGALGLVIATSVMLALREFSGSGPAPRGALRRRSRPG
jgi:membrane-associated phospholipid phosphatase